ncbi:MAG: DUF4258 domain-containing protein [Nitrospiraceae bacterium]|nr:MAG: DUF4258 domain-containing protein [Nitrospiraceae bacterium]
MKQIKFSDHAKAQMSLRGASVEEVVIAINSGTWESAKLGKFKRKHKFEYNEVSMVNQKIYKYKTVEPVFADENDKIIVITVKVYYSNE